MRKIDLQSYPRREQFQLFSDFNHPHFNLCANVDLTKFLLFIKAHHYSFTPALVYVISRAANTIPEFRYRLREGEIVEHVTVSPSLTVLVKNDLFSFCTIDYCPDFSEFAARAARVMAAVQENPTLKDPPGRDDLLYMTALPWVSFTSFTHPMNQHPADSFPRFAWGRYFQEGDLIKMPLSVQGHHALMDGIHLGKYYGVIEEFLECPEDVLGEV